jgi:hypothetical protein
MTFTSALSQIYRKAGPLRFWSILVALLCYVAAFAWLGVHAAWPADCHPAPRQTVMLFWCSPRLLGGGWMELVLFAVIWALPSGIALYFIRHRRRHGAL